MFTNMLKQYALKQRQLRSQVGDLLLRRLEREDSLVVDKALISQLGVSRRTLFRVIYGLVVKERMYMVADTDGRVRLFTNAEYRRSLLRRSGVRETEIRRREGAVVAQDTVVEQAMAEVLEETVVVDSVCAEVMEPTLVASAPKGADKAIRRTSSRLLGRVVEQALGGPLRQGDPRKENGPAPDEYGWFKIDVAPTRNREKVPGERQSLPDRSRNPWAVLDGAGLDLE